ncbi:hypothetical protein [Actinocorallia herbida]|uniref:hypothetical protein n=1 Tax=Actinocorallia herbida TaxID=58109 RepID=UPI0011CE5310|nr:hypothetical protein [Actinocorallia herbida]
MEDEAEITAPGGARAGVGEEGAEGVVRTGSSATLSGPHAVGEEYYNLPRAHFKTGHPHGKTSSWVVVVTAIVALVVGAVAFVLHAWVLMWICAVIAVLCFPAGLAVKIMDDTVSWGAPTPGSIPRGQIIRGANQIHDRDRRSFEEARETSREQTKQHH